MNGVRVYKDGKITLEITDRLTRTLGQFEIPTNVDSGSFSVNFPEDSTPFLIVHNYETGAIYNSGVQGLRSYVAVNVVGNTIQWSRSLTVGIRPLFPITVIYGVY